MLYMSALVTKTGTSLPSRTLQFLALQITFRLKRASSPSLLLSLFFLPLSLFLSSFPLFPPKCAPMCSRFQPGVDACDDLSIDPSIEVRSVTGYIIYVLFYKRGCYLFATADIKYLGVICERNIWIYVGRESSNVNGA